MSQPPPAPPRPSHTSPGGWHHIVREPDDRKIAGVCGGLADRLGVDVTVLRTAVVVLTLITPLALIGYLVASVALPKRRPDQPRIRSQPVHLGQVPHWVIVVGAIVAVTTLVDDAWWLKPFPAAVALVGVGVWLIVQGREDEETMPARPTPPTPPAPGTSPTDSSGDVPADASTLEHPMADTTEPLKSREGAGPSGEFPPPASPWWSGSPAAPSAAARLRRSRVGAAVVALLFVGAGIVWMLHSLGIAETSWSDGLALGLLAVGAGLLLTAWRGRAYALVPIGGILVALLVVGEAFDVPLDAGAGERTVVVDTVRELDLHHELFAGELTVDLTEAPLSPDEPTRVEASVGAGQLNVLVPDGTTVVVDAAVRIGEVVSDGGADANETGVGVDDSFTLDGGLGAPRLELDLSVGFGSVEVARG